MLQILLTLPFFALEFRSISGQWMNLPISSISESRFLSPGDDVNITCKYSSQMGSYHRKWVFINDQNSTDIASNDILTNDFGGRYTVSTSRTLGERENKYRKYELILKDLRPSDSGKYQCDIFFPDGKKASMWTYILVFPLTDYVQVLEGDDAYLECFPKTFMASNITWISIPNKFLDGFTVKDSVLTIPSVNKDHAGVYSCKGKIKLMNSEALLSTIIERMIYLDVVPPLEVKVHNSIVTRPRGYNVNLTCFVYSLPNASVLWYKGRDEKFPISTSESISEAIINSLTIARKVIVSVHRIVQITSEDYDEYTCKASNIFSDESATITLQNSHQINLIN